MARVREAAMARIGPEAGGAIGLRPAGHPEPDW